jgi:serine/threonine-protein kinase
MTPRDGDTGRTGCPAPDVLRAFGLGDLPEGPFDAVAAHVAACPECAAALGGLEVTGPLVRGLRGLPGPLSGPPTARAPDGPALPQRLGRYELLEELGQGGMGVVYKARQERPSRLVAVKLVLGGAMAGPGALARLRTEAEAAGRLRHEDVVRVIDYGEQDGRAYVVMEYVAGSNLAGRLRAGPLPPREAATLVRRLALAVQAAHEQRIVHRDLKPANVLLTEDGAPKIADFGLAVLLDEAARQTQSGAVLGTPPYMAPEQARGEARAVGPATDVYGLGAILYECLTGRPPFVAAGREQTLDLVRTREPEPPGRLCRGLSPELEAVCLKCLHKEVGRRYDSAAALAADLTNWLTDRPTVARPPGWLGRRWRAVRRRPRAALSALAVLAAAALAPLVLRTDGPDKALEVIEGRLAAGERVVLIGASGGPAWQCWEQGGDVGRTTVLSDGSFYVSGRELGLVELVRDPRRERYRFRAEVRHDGHTAGTSRVGLYCCRRAYPGEGLPKHLFAQLSFDDRQPAAAEWDRLHGARPEGRDRPPRPSGNRVFLLPTLAASLDGKAHGSHPFAFPAPELFQPQPDEWRTLELEVTPESVRAWWGEDRRQPVGELTAQAVRQRVEKEQRLALERDPGHRFLLGIEPRLPPRGGLGLFVTSGSASFRNVEVEPLPAPP